MAYFVGINNISVDKAELSEKGYQIIPIMNKNGQLNLISIIIKEPNGTYVNTYIVISIKEEPFIYAVVDIKTIDPGFAIFNILKNFLGEETTPPDMKKENKFSINIDTEISNKEEFKRNIIEQLEQSKFH